MDRPPESLSHTRQIATGSTRPDEPVEAASPSALAPSGLLCQLLAHPDRTVIHTAHPRFGWVVNDRRPGAAQSAYQILLGLDMRRLTEGRGDLWDSGRVSSSRSIDVAYEGPPLASHRGYFWQVRTWNHHGDRSPWSSPQRLRTGEISDVHLTSRYPLERTLVRPVHIAQTAAETWFIDFGRAAFGTVRLTLTSPAAGRCVRIHLGERLSGVHTIDRSPPGCIRHTELSLSLKKGTHTYTLRVPPDERNTTPPAILMPPEIGEVTPFRYCEIIDAPSPVEASTARQVAVYYPFDEDAAHFTCSDDTLNQVWELCKYSIMATSFCGVYVDGDRERIAYEGDAYVNQLCHYCVDREFTLARHSHEYLIFQPTWPTEWALHSVFMAWTDYQYTGNTDSLAAHYGDLKAKVLLSLAREDGLISSARATDQIRESIHLEMEMRDLVDWPPGSFTEGKQGERDGYELVEENTVINAYHYRALVLMGRIATALDRPKDGDLFRERAARVAGAIGEKLFDSRRGVYVDGESSTHASLHANMLPLAFDLVPECHRDRVAAFVKSRGMACSVFGAQYLLEALYRAGEEVHALALMTARHDRSWWNMIRLGSTVSLEAWDWQYKNNLDWNHAWGAVPANIIPRFLMGVRPLEPGFGRMLIQPRPGPLECGELRMPTIRGAVEAAFEQRAGRSFALRVCIPANTSARVDLPLPPGAPPTVLLDGCVQEAGIRPTVGSGRHVVEWRR